MQSKKKLPAPLYAVDKKLRTLGKDPELVAWNDYFIPRTNTMRNLLGDPPGHYGISDPRKLRDYEEKLSMIRSLEMKLHPLPGAFDYQHMKDVHHHLFQDVYPWAGQQRTVTMNKGRHEYAPVGKIEAIWEKQGKLLEDKDHLKGIADHGEFVDQLAQHWGMINYAHAFREGNTRSQTAFFSQLSTEAGWSLDASLLDPTKLSSLQGKFTNARYHHQDNRSFDHGPLAQVLGQIITAAPQAQPAPVRAKVVAQPSPDYSNHAATGHDTDYGG